jgi:3-hydroxybutyryl-CoA dehydratase
MNASLSRDFDALTVGDRFTTRARTITEADLVAFATLTGDMHPQHTDAEWSATSMFGERIAHGMLIVSYALGMLDFDPERVIALRRVREAVFKRPVAIGDTVHVDGRIDRLDELDALTGIVGVRLDVVNQRSKAVARAGIDVIWRRGDATVGLAVEEAFELAGLPI